MEIGVSVALEQGRVLFLQGDVVFARAFNAGVLLRDRLAEAEASVGALQARLEQALWQLAETSREEREFVVSPDVKKTIAGEIIFDGYVRRGSTLARLQMACARKLPTLSSPAFASIKSRRTLSQRPGSVGRARPRRGASAARAA